VAAADVGGIVEWKAWAAEGISADGEGVRGHGRSMSVVPGLCVPVKREATEEGKGRECGEGVWRGGDVLRVTSDGPVFRQHRA
jgi:hypothetical protein